MTQFPFLFPSFYRKLGILMVIIFLIFFLLKLSISYLYVFDIHYLRLGFLLGLFLLVFSKQSEQANELTFDVHRNSIVMSFGFVQMVLLAYCIVASYKNISLHVKDIELFILMGLLLQIFYFNLWKLFYVSNNLPFFNSIKSKKIKNFWIYVISFVITLAMSAMYALS